MNRMNRSLLAAIVAGGLCGGVGFVQAGSSTGGVYPGVQKLDDEHWHYPHMHHALVNLREARKELEQSEDVFRGHKDEAIDHVDKAIHAIQDGLHEQHDEEAALPAASWSAVNLDDDHFPHMHLALERLKDAKHELEASESIFAGHRDEAISHTERAMKQIEDALH
jgi:hypothetical protein